jgi:uncharacterized protein (TIGR02145 family)
MNNKIRKIFKLSAIVSLILVCLGCSKQDVPLPEQPTLTVIDADGNSYHTIEIGNQIWMVENLKTTKFNDGTPISHYTFSAHGNNWGSLNNQEPFYRWADTADLNNVVEETLTFDAYGAMYNHFAIESGKLAPKGWRIPSEADFKTLETFIANDGNAGKEATVLKTTTHWFESSGNGTNLYGFNGVPNGYISTPGTATFANGICTWATINFNTANSTRKMVQLFNQPTIIYSDNAIQLGAGIRCIQE